MGLCKTHKNCGVHSIGKLFDKLFLSLCYCDVGKQCRQTCASDVWFVRNKPRMFENLQETKQQVKCVTLAEQCNAGDLP